MLLVITYFPTKKRTALILNFSKASYKISEEDECARELIDASVNVVVFLKITTFGGTSTNLIHSQERWLLPSAKTFGILSKSQKKTESLFSPLLSNMSAS